MIRDRLCMFFGGVASLAGAGTLVYAGSRLLHVVDALHRAPQGLRNDLNLAQASSAGLAAGACLVTYGLDLARRTRWTTGVGKLGTSAAGLLIVLSSALLFMAFHHAADELARLREIGHLNAGYEDLAGDVETVVRGGRGAVFGGFCILLCSQIILSLSLWPLYWSHAAPHGPAPSRKRALSIGVGSAVLFAGLIFLATVSGGYALQASPPQGNPDLLEAVRHVEWLLLWTRGAFVALATSGGVLVLQGIRFPLRRG